MQTEIIGWASALILLLTVSSQVFQQWRSHTTAGVSNWLFIGQISASAGFVIYSALVANWVFVATNTFLLLTATLGQILFLRNKRREENKRNAKSSVESNARRNVTDPYSHGESQSGSNNFPLSGF